MSQEKQTPEQSLDVSRRTMMASSGAAVATAAMVATTDGMDLPTIGQNMEIAKWKRLIGSTFSVGNTSMRLLLAGLETMNGPDPNRPKHFREPFTLIFKQEKGQILAAGTYRITAGRESFDNVFLNEVMAEEYDHLPVVQAVFG